MRYFFLVVLLVYGLHAQAAEIGIAQKAVYQAPIAKTRKELSQGLMYVKTLERNAGMFFDFREYGQAVSMWMKNTYVPLDMIFIDCAFKIVDIYPNAEPLSLKTISSDKPFCYVLEINAGEAQNKSLAVGDEVFIRLE